LKYNAEHKKLRNYNAMGQQGLSTAFTVQWGNKACPLLLQCSGATRAVHCFYSAVGQQGLSTAFTRSFFSILSANGSLVTIQEISGGLLK
jgi:hypothetical protein